MQISHPRKIPEGLTTVFTRVYKSTFYDQKIALDLYTSHTQRPDQAVRESALGKPVIIVVDFHQFSAHSSSTKSVK